MYVYAICESSLPAPAGLAGVGGAEVEIVAHDDLAAACSRLADGEAPEATPDALLAHERVVETLMRERALLPTRFGMTLGGEDDVRRVLAARADGLRAGLAAVRGCVELGVRVRWEEDGAEPRAGSGREYLDVLREAERRAGEATDVVHRPLAAIARASTCTPAPGGGTLASAYLVAADEVQPFAQRVMELQDGLPELDISCTGPWPPYSFTGDGA